MKKILFIFLMLVLFSGCKSKDLTTQNAPAEQQEPASTQAVKQEPQMSEEPAVDTAPAKNQPPRIIGVDCTPEFPVIGDTIKASAMANDPDGDEVRLSFQWFKNDEVLDETSDSLMITDGFKRGDRITVMILPDDGKAKGNTGMLKIVISNSPPEIISSPNEFKVENRKFTYQVRSKDKENDPVTYSLKEFPAGMTIDPNTGLIQWNVPDDLKDRTSISLLAKDDNGGETAQSFAFDTKH